MTGIEITVASLCNVNVSVIEKVNKSCAMGLRCDANLHFVGSQHVAIVNAFTKLKIS